MDDEEKVDTHEDEKDDGEETPREDNAYSSLNRYPINTEATEADLQFINEIDTPRDYLQHVGTGFELDDDRRISDEHVPLRRRLTDNDRGIQARIDQQTDLLADLQNRLKDSQRRMAEMEAAERSAAAMATISAPSTSTISSPLMSPANSTPRKSINVEAADDLMLNRLIEEQDRNATLNDMASTLRRDLDESKAININLTSDYLRLTQEYERTKREMNNRTEEYKNTEKLYLERLACEHRQLLKLWSSFQQLRRDYLDCFSLTKRGLNSMDSELQRLSKGSSTACQKLNMWMAYAASARALDSNAVDMPDWSSLSMNADGNCSVEDMILENIRRLTDSQKEKDEIIKQIQQREQSITNQCTILQQEKQTLIGEKDGAIKERETLEKRLEQAKSENMEMQRKRETVEMDLRTQREDLDALRQTEVSWNQERIDLCNQLEKRDAQLHEFDSHFLELKKEYQQTDQHLKMAVEKQRDLEIQLESTRRELISENEKSASNYQQQIRMLEQEKRMEEERCRDAKEQLNKSKKESKTRFEQINILESKIIDWERKSSDYESELKSLQKQLSISRETEIDLKRQLENSVNQKQNLQLRTDDLQRKLELLEMEKREWLTLKPKLESDAANLKRKIILYQDELKKNEEALLAAALGRESDNKAMDRMEKENMQLHDTVTQLQTQVARMEQTQSQKQVEQKSRLELENEQIKRQSELEDALRQYESIRKADQHRIKILEEENKRLNGIISHETRLRQEYFANSVQKSREMSQLQSEKFQLHGGLESSFISMRNETSMLKSTSPLGSLAQSSTPIKSTTLGSLTGKNLFSK